jgi:hypothetical protein
MKRRTGATLIEVLVAIFVSALGLLALLALFPVGALSMAQAIKDARCAQAAGTAASIAEIQQVRNDTALTNAPNAFTNPGLGLWDLSTAQLGYDGPSYPVCADALTGSYTGANTLGSIALLGPPPFVSPGFARRVPNFVAAAASPYLQYLKFFTIQDDITFDNTGIPIGVPNQIEREGRYSWAYLLRRPRYSVSSVVDMTVIIYSGRSQAVLGESAYGPVGFNPNLNTVTVSWNPAAGQQAPNIRPGTWILDATVQNPYKINPTTNMPYVPPYPDPHGFFYRVIGVIEAAPTQLILELQTNPRQSSIDPITNNSYGVLVVMDNVVEIIEKGPGWLP